MTPDSGDSQLRFVCSSSTSHSGSSSLACVVRPSQHVRLAWMPCVPVSSAAPGRNSICKRTHLFYSSLLALLVVSHASSTHGHVYPFLAYGMVAMSPAAHDTALLLQSPGLFAASFKPLQASRTDLALLPHVHLPHQSLATRCISWPQTYHTAGPCHPS